MSTDKLIILHFVPLKDGGAMMLKILAFSRLKYPKPNKTLCMFSMFSQKVNNIEEGLEILVYLIFKRFPTLSRVIILKWGRRNSIDINYFVADDLMKSEGVDKARGLVFSLDTMQSYLVTKRRRHLENIPINSFLIKLHQPGRTTNKSLLL